MLKLLVLLLLAPDPSLPTSNIRLHDRGIGPTAVTDKDLRPVKPRDCQNEAEVQRAVAQVRQGEPGDCFVRDATAFNRYKG